MRLSLIFFMLIFFSCSSGLDIKPVDINNTGKSESRAKGSFFTGKSSTKHSFSELTNRDGKTSSLPVNAILWRASLDIASTIPIEDIDVYSGSIISDWYSLPNNQSERIKVSIFVLDRELRSDAIRSVVHVQSHNGKNWSDSGKDVDLGKKIEELILTRSREIRSSLIKESN